MIDLSQSKTRGVGHLMKVGARRDGSKENRLIFDVEVAFQITNDEEAQVTDNVVPGAFRCWQISANDEDSQANYSRSVAEPCGHLQLLDPELGDSVDATSEILRVQVKGSRRGMFLMVKCRLHGLDTPEAAKILEWLNEPVEMSFEKDQQTLAFPDISPNAVPGREMEIVSVAMPTGDTVFGRVFVDTGAKLQMENFGNPKFIGRRSDVQVSLHVRVHDDFSDVDQWLLEYMGACEQSGVDPHWEPVIIALGQSLHELGDDEVILTRETMKTAVTILSEAVPA